VDCWQGAGAVWPAGHTFAVPRFVLDAPLSVRPSLPSTVKFCVTGLAAAYVPFPVCEAVREHLPGVSSVTMLPETVQTLRVEEL